MTRERLDEIFESIESKWEGDNAFQGLSILSEYTDYVLHGAMHDKIWGPDVDKILEAGLTYHDAVKLRQLNWMIEDDGFACFV